MCVLIRLWRQNYFCWVHLFEVENFGVIHRQGCNPGLRHTCDETRESCYVLGLARVMLGKVHDCLTLQCNCFYGVAYSCRAALDIKMWWKSVLP